MKNATTTTRNPGGLVKGKPIALRLMPGELEEAGRVAEKRHLSKSAMARQAYLLGLPLLKQQPAKTS